MFICHQGKGGYEEKKHYEDEKEDMKNTSENLTVGGSDPLSSWFP